MTAEDKITSDQSESKGMLPQTAVDEYVETNWSNKLSQKARKKKPEKSSRKDSTDPRKERAKTKKELYWERKANTIDYFQQCIMLPRRNGPVKQQEPFPPRTLGTERPFPKHTSHSAESCIRIARAKTFSSPTSAISRRSQSKTAARTSRSTSNSGIGSPPSGTRTVIGNRARSIHSTATAQSYSQRRVNR